ncbi:MAG: amidohydrolase [Alphaproteobacteria bacterium]|nr:amidohydrolase [Alphaproteobacteria bacterium]
MLLLKNVYLGGKTQDILIEHNCFKKIADEINDDNADIKDCTGKAILPSFCNMHTHAAMMFLKGIGEDLELFDWLQTKIWPLEAKLTGEDVYHLSKFAALEMIKTGTTMFLDMYFYVEETIKAIDEMGLRAVITYLGMDMFDEAETKRRLENAEKFMKQSVPSTRIIKGLSAHAVYTASKELIQGFKKIARAHDAFFSIHVSETKKEVEDCLKKYGKTPLALLDEWGVLDEKTIVAHAVHLTKEETDIAKKRKIVLAHNPVSNLKLNSGQMPLQAYLDKGLRVTLGTDGVSSNNSLSMIDEMKTAALSGKNIASDSTAAKVNDIFNMATINGFEALGVKTGKIEEGYEADFMLVDLNNHTLLPNINLISNMVYAADSSCITDVFCQGKPLMKNKCVENEDNIVLNFKKTCEELLKD